MRLVLGLAIAACACSTGQGPPLDSALDGLAVRALGPAAWVPGTEVVITGEAFVPAEFGLATLVLRGEQGGVAAEVALPATFVDYGRMRVAWTGGVAMGLPADDGQFVGEAVLEIVSGADGRTYRSAPLAVTVDVAGQLTPALDRVDIGAVRVNDPIAVDGAGFLLGGNEGGSHARLEGCFRLEGTQVCNPVAAVEIPVVPGADRGHAHFPLSPRATGIRPGRFEGTVTLINRHLGGASPASAPLPFVVDVLPVTISQVLPAAASLGQYVEIAGGGFVAAEPGAVDLLTTLELTGSFAPAFGGGPRAVSLLLVPEFVRGPLVRYVLSEDDSLGQLIDLRTERGVITGTLRPIVARGGEQVTGAAVPVTLTIAPVKQVIWVRFTPAYVESLRHFGLRAVDQAVRQRVLEVARRDFAGVNVELRTEQPTDFALFSTLDIGGPDPNGRGYFGYDNTPGKDSGNLRLYDEIGGVNALTLANGNPGYGGIFVESFFTFSEHPVAPVTAEDPQPLFDRVFDRFRPDLGGQPVAALDLGGGVMLPASGAACPASERRAAIGCAVWVLGNLIGTTMTHEIGHSLGLANPDGMGFHNVGDEPNRLMDGGTARTFAERAELDGQGPAVFCDAELAYLRGILPSDDPPPDVTRPGCF